MTSTAHNPHNRMENDRRIRPPKASQERIKREDAPLLWLLEPEKHLRIFENFRAFKNKMSALLTDHGYQVFLLTGTGSGVGTSTMIFNLALTLGWDLADKKILLVDANAHRPALHNGFEIPLAPGLLDYLEKNTPFEEIHKPSSLPGLSLVSIGDLAAQTFSSFNMSGFARFLDTAKQAFDIILLDTAPVLRSSQTRLMSTKVDGVILVVEAMRTRSEVIDAISAQLESDGARLLGSFLNKRRFVIPKWLYRFL